MCDHPRQKNPMEGDKPDPSIALHTSSPGTQSSWTFDGLSSRSHPASSSDPYEMGTTLFAWAVAWILHTKGLCVDVVCPAVDSASLKDKETVRQSKWMTLMMRRLQVPAKALSPPRHPLDPADPNNKQLSNAVATAVESVLVILRLVALAGLLLLLVWTAVDRSACGPATNEDWLTALRPGPLRDCVAVATSTSAFATFLAPSTPTRLGVMTSLFVMVSLSSQNATVSSN
eukprot:gene3155-3685_t